MLHNIMVFKLEIVKMLGFFFQTKPTITEMSDPVYLDKPWRKFPEFDAEV